MVQAIALYLAQAAALQPAPAQVVGIGNHSCGQWTSALRDKKDITRGAYYAWIGGFITGMNASGNRLHGNLTDGIDFDGMSGWVDNYCAANPLEPISSAAIGLAIELLKRKANRQ